jgi:hypothetical protein
VSVPKIAVAVSMKMSTKRPDSQRRFTHCSGPFYCALSQPSVNASRLFMDDRSLIPSRDEDLCFLLFSQSIPRAYPDSYPSCTGDQHYSNRGMNVTINLHIVPRSRMHLCFDFVRVHCVVLMFSSDLPYFTTREAVRVSRCEAILVNVKNN